MSRREATTAEARKNQSTELCIVLSSAAGISVVPLPEKDVVTIGRGSECDVVIDDESVSRRHASIRAHQIEDLGSRNGTTVGGRRIAPGERVGLDVGIVVAIGSATLLIHRGAAIGAPAQGTQANTSPPPSGPILADPTMQRMYAMLDVIASSELPIVVLGETGTGKEVFASYAHARSLRAKAPFLCLNCAALSGSLLESELFGHERGAFTGALSAKPGLFESANGGTVFLDEVAELPLETQAKLLRVLENGEVFRLGSVKPRRVDVRYVAATNRDLAALSQGGLFRSDLFYRLNGVTFTLPPLRKRAAEILPLATYFLELAALKKKRPPPTFSIETVEALLAYEWPGNVRELKSVIERAFVLTDGAPVIAAARLLLPARSNDVAPFEDRAIVANTSGSRDAYEKERVLEALQRAGGNQTMAAKLLGVSRRTLINKLEKFSLHRPRKGG